MAGSCEDSNECSGFVKDGKFIWPGKQLSVSGRTVIHQVCWYIFNTLMNFRFHKRRGFSVRLSEWIFQGLLMESSYNSCACKLFQTFMNSALFFTCERTAAACGILCFNGGVVLSATFIYRPCNFHGDDDRPLCSACVCWWVIGLYISTKLLTQATSNSFEGRRMQLER